MIFYNNGLRPCFTRLHANIVEEDGAFTVSVRIFNHLKTKEFRLGSGNCRDIRHGEPDGRSLADQFSIPQNCISIKIVMWRHRDGTIH